MNEVRIASPIWGRATISSSELVPPIQCWRVVVGQGVGRLVAIGRGRLPAQRHGQSAGGLVLAGRPDPRRDEGGGRRARLGRVQRRGGPTPLPPDRRQRDAVDAQLPAAVPGGRRLPLDRGRGRAPHRPAALRLLRHRGQPGPAHGPQNNS